MSSAFVIKKKPRFYKIGARIFKWLILCNKVVEMEKVGKVIETEGKFLGSNFAWVFEDELGEHEYEQHIGLDKKEK